MTATLAACSVSTRTTSDPAAPEGAPSRPPGVAPHVPDGVALVGAAVRPSLPVSGPQVAAYAGFDRVIQATTTVANLFRTWDRPLLPEDVQQIADAGKVPLLSWNASDIPGIAAGVHDDFIRRQAEAVAASGVGVLVRFRWEMDRPNLRATVGRPATYVAAWRRARAIFDEVGVPTAAWVWCPTAAGFEPGGDAADFYPGDDSVDWLCADAYPGRDLRSLESLMTPFLAWAADHRRPVMVGEFGVPRTGTDDERAAWLDQARVWLRDRPDIDAVVYFAIDVEPTAPVLQYGIDPGTDTAGALGRMFSELDAGVGA